MTPKCIVCDRPLENPHPHESDRAVPRNDSIGMVDGGLFFRATGNYGSVIFDPMDDQYIEVVICDACVMAKSESHGIRHTVVDGRRIVREDVPFKDWRGTMGGQEWLERRSPEPLSRPYASVSEMIRDISDPEFVGFAAEFDAMIAEKLKRQKGEVTP